MIDIDLCEFSIKFVQVLAFLHVTNDINFLNLPRNGPYNQSNKSCRLIVHFNTLILGRKETPTTIMTTCNSRKTHPIELSKHKMHWKFKSDEDKRKKLST